MRVVHADGDVAVHLVLHSRQVGVAVLALEVRIHVRARCPSGEVEGATTDAVGDDGAGAQVVGIGAVVRVLADVDLRLRAQRAVGQIERDVLVEAPVRPVHLRQAAAGEVIDQADARSPVGQVDAGARMLIAGDVEVLPVAGVHQLLLAPDADVEDHLVEDVPGVLREECDRRVLRLVRGDGIGEPVRVVGVESSLTRPVGIDVTVRAVVLDQAARQDAQRGATRVRLRTRRPRAAVPPGRSSPR